MQGRGALSVPAIRKQSCLIQIKTRVQKSLKLFSMPAIKPSGPTPTTSPDALEGVRLAQESVITLRKQLEADRPRHRNLLSRSKELLAQSEDLLAKTSSRAMPRSASYLLFDNLALAERHIGQGFGIIARQRELIAALERGGHATEDAINLLADFEDIQALHVADRDRLRKELGIES